MKNWRSGEFSSNVILMGCPRETWENTLSGLAVLMFTTSSEKAVVVLAMLVDAGVLVVVVAVFGTTVGEVVVVVTAAVLIALLVACTACCWFDLPAWFLLRIAPDCLALSIRTSFRILR